MSLLRFRHSGSLRGRIHRAARDGTCSARIDPHPASPSFLLPSPWKNLLNMTKYPLLKTIDDPAALRSLDRRALKQLADELRAFVLESVSRTGGHLSSNLGTVELTIALHYVFNTPHDRIVWDVGHQTYPHKILTGRRAAMATLRQ